MSREDRRRERRMEQHQHRQDQHVIEHLVGDRTKPATRPGGGRGADATGGEAPRHFGPRRGRVLQEAIKKEWTPAKGGLPDF